MITKSEPPLEIPMAVTSAPYARGTLAEKCWTNLDKMPFNLACRAPLNGGLAFRVSRSRWHPYGVSSMRSTVQLSCYNRR